MAVLVELAGASGSGVQGPQQPCLRSTLKPASLLELSCQVSLSWVAVPGTVSTRSQVGAAGGVRLVVNVAVTERSVSSVTVQLPVPVQAPLQPPKVEPDAGAAVKVTVVPAVKEAEQEVPQLIPAGLLVTVPAPVPAFPTERMCPAVQETPP